jgi:hypothetical protein
VRLGFEWQPRRSDHITRTDMRRRHIETILSVIGRPSDFLR